jgi:hypothetical protein
LADLVAAARAKIEEIETRDFIALVGDQTVVKVDIRDIRKRQRDFSIPGSVLAPCGMIKFWVDPDSSGFKGNRTIGTACLSLGL